MDWHDHYYVFAKLYKRLLAALNTYSQASEVRIISIRNTVWKGTLNNFMLEIQPEEISYM